MLTTQPCVTIGSYTWAQDQLPSDEFGLRLDDLRTAMARHNWPAVLVYGDVREHAALAYLTNFIPRVRWGMALLPRSGDARLLCAMSTRDLPAMRTLTWIADVKSGMGRELQKSFDPWFERFAGADPLELGTLGFDIMAPPLHDAVRRSLGARFSLRRADDLVATPPDRKRPRELTMMRASCRLLETAAKALVENWRTGNEPETAALEAERLARSLAAQDVRTLVSLDRGRTLVPYRGRFEKKDGPLLAYLAVKVMGYWADRFITVHHGGCRTHARITSRAGRARCGHRRGAAGCPGRRALRQGDGGACALPAASGAERQRRPRHRPVAQRTTRIPRGCRRRFGGGRHLHAAGRPCRRRSRQRADVRHRA
jgi:hypothetical protein